MCACCLFFLFFLFHVEANGAIRLNYSAKAKTKHKHCQALSVPIQPLQDELDNDGFGLQGVGDRNHPVSCDLLRHLLQQHKAFVKRCSSAWRSELSDICPDGKCPSCSLKKIHCSLDFCWTASKARLVPGQVRFVTGLLKNILRSMRPQSIRKASRMTSIHSY